MLHITLASYYYYPAPVTILVVSENICCDSSCLSVSLLSRHSSHDHNINH